jgi:hypothetical protein
VGISHRILTDSVLFELDLAAALGAIAGRIPGGHQSLGAVEPKKRPGKKNEAAPRDTAAAEDCSPPGW